MSEDGLSYTFHLRSGATFQSADNKPVTAEDVVYTFQRLLDPANGLTATAALTFLDRVEAVDERTVEFHLKKPNVTVLFTLAGVNYSIVPKGATNKQLSQETMGSGPFQLIENTPGERTVLKRNANYWNPDLPYVDEVHLLVIPEIAGQIAALTSGTTDMVAQVGIDQLPLLETIPTIQVTETEWIAHLFVMRVTEEPFRDLRVRQAFKHAIDRNALQQALLYGRGVIGNDQVIAPGNPFWADLPPLAYDVTKAKQLLAEAGYANGQEAGYANGQAVTLSVTDFTPGIVDAAVVLQEMFKAVGVTITLDKVAVDAYLAQKYGQVPFFIDYTPAPNDPDALLSLYFGTNAPYNVSGWSDTEVDALLDAARSEGDLAKRKEIYYQLQQRISQDGPVLSPYFIPSFVALRSNVRGAKATGLVQAEAIWLQP